MSQLLALKVWQNYLKEASNVVPHKASFWQFISRLRNPWYTPINIIVVESGTMCLFHSWRTLLLVVSSWARTLLYSCHNSFSTCTRYWLYPLVWVLSTPSSLIRRSIPLLRWDISYPRLIPIFCCHSEPIHLIHPVTLLQFYEQHPWNPPPASKPLGI